MTKQYQTGLFIGRFQPFHLGHLSAIKQGLEVAENIIIAIGSANRNLSFDNPLIVDERISLVAKVLEEEEIKDRISEIYTLNDNPNNLEWVETLIQTLPSFEVVICNNNLVTLLTSFKGFPQFHPKLTKREILQGLIIRNNILQHKSWQECVPKYTVSLLKKFQLEKRLLAL